MPALPPSASVSALPSPRVVHRFRRSACTISRLRPSVHRADVAGRWLKLRASLVAVSRARTNARPRDTTLAAARLTSLSFPFPLPFSSAAFLAAAANDASRRRRRPTCTWVQRSERPGEFSETTDPLACADANARLAHGCARAHTHTNNRNTKQTNKQTHRRELRAHLRPTLQPLVFGPLSIGCGTCAHHFA